MKLGIVARYRFLSFYAPLYMEIFPDIAMLSELFDHIIPYHFTHPYAILV